MVFHRRPLGSTLVPCIIFMVALALPTPADQLPPDCMALPAWSRLCDAQAWAAPPHQAKCTKALKRQSARCLHTLKLMTLRQSLRGGGESARLGAASSREPSPALENVSMREMLQYARQVQEEFRQHGEALDAHARQDARAREKLTMLRSELNALIDRAAPDSADPLGGGDAGLDSSLDAEDPALLGTPDVPARMLEMARALEELDTATAAMLAEDPPPPPPAALRLPGVDAAAAWLLAAGEEPWGDTNERSAPRRPRAPAPTRPCAALLPRARCCARARVGLSARHARPAAS
jgi:hypothetical protein